MSEDFDPMFEKAVGDADAQASHDLTVAAPKLLDALERMLGDYEDQLGMNFCECDSSVNLKCNACFARSAIALANGA